MTIIDRRAACFAALALFALTAAACGDNEPEQRKAFIGFLQTSVVNRPGAHLSTLTADDKKKFGDYTAHYDVLAEFVTDASIRNLSQKLNQTLSSMSSLAAVIDKRDVLRKSAGDLAGILKAIDERFEKTKAARAALKQPDDLKAVYNVAFDKLIARPVQGFHGSLPDAEAALVTSANVGDYIAAHRDKINFNGNSVSGKDKTTQAELMEMVGKVKSDGEKFQVSFRKLLVILEGS